MASKRTSVPSRGAKDKPRKKGTEFEIQELDNGTFRTCEVRLSFPNIFERGEPMEDGGEGRYGATLLFPEGADLSALEEAAEECAREFFGKEYEKVTKAKSFRWPFRDQGEREEYEGYEPGCVFINTTSTRRPQVFDRYKEPIDDRHSDEIYPGVWALAVIRPFAYNKKGNKGVSFGLQGIMKLRDDEAFGGMGKIDSDKAFGDIDVGQDEDVGGVFRGNGNGRARDDDEDDRPRGRSSARRSRDDDEDDRPRGRSSARRGRRDELDDEIPF